MCGRICCALSPDIYQKASSYYNKEKGNFLKPNWREEMNNMKFHPSVNLSPSKCVPVLISGKHFSDEDAKQVLMPMLWQMIPKWHKGEPLRHGLSTNNARLEGLTTSKLYWPCLKRGSRAVVVCEGFYEWKGLGKLNKKQPYLFYLPQKKGMKVEDHEGWAAEGSWSEELGWTGPSLLKMAAIYDTWNSNKDEKIYSLSIITMESSRCMSWCHDRMPAILTTNEDVEAWLDFEGVKFPEALEVLKPADTLSYHPVDSALGNSSSQDPNINKPVKVSLEKSLGSTSIMSKWLEGGFASLKRNIDPKEDPLKKLRSGDSKQVFTVSSRDTSECGVTIKSEIKKEEDD